jgi:hypothetical protein
MPVFQRLLWTGILILRLNRFETGYAKILRRLATIAGPRGNSEANALRRRPCLTFLNERKERRMDKKAAPKTERPLDSALAVRGYLAPASEGRVSSAPLP